MRLLFFLLPLSLFAQARGEEAADRMARADREFFRAAYALSVEHCGRAADLFRGAGEAEKEVRATALAAESCLRLSELDRAEEWLKRSMGRVVNGLGDRPTPAAAYAHEISAQWALAKGNPRGALPRAEKSLAMRQGFSGKEADADRVRSLLVLAKTLLALSQLPEAENALQKAGPLAAALGPEHPLLVDLELARASCAYERGALEQMRRHNEIALDLSLQIHGETHDRTADAYAQSSLYYKLALAADDIELRLLAKAFDIREQLFGDRPSLSLADSYERLAELNYNLSDLDGALDCYLKAQEIYAAVYRTETHPDVALCYVLMARCYGRKGNSDSEFVNLQKALGIQLATLPANSDFLANTYNELSIHYGKQENCALQLLYAQKAYDIWARTKGPESAYASIGMANMAAAYGGIPGEEHREKALLETALAIKVKLMGEFARGTARNYYQLGRYHQKNGDFERALDFFQRSLMANSRGFRQTDPARNPSVGQALSLGQFVETLRAKAQTFSAAARRSSDGGKSLQRAYSTYGICLAAIDTLRLDIKSPGSKQDILLNFFPVFEEAIAMAKVLYEAGGEKRYLHEAFRVAERSKAYLLQQALRESESKGHGSVPDSVVAREREFRSRKDFWAQKTIEAEMQTEAPDLSALRDSLRRAKRRMEDYARWLEIRYPQYHRIKYRSETASVEDIRSGLTDKNTLLLEYFWGDSAVYLFAVGHDDVRLFALPSPNRLDEQLELLQQNLSDYAALAGDPEEAWRSFRGLAWPVFRDLVRPALAGRGYNRLVVVPDGRLNAIPFEALLTDSVQGGLQPDFARLPYLVRDFAVSYGYSATLLCQHAQKTSRTGVPRFAAFAPAYRYGPPSDTAAPLPLPGAEREIGALSKWFEGRSFLGREATESRFKDCAGRYDIVHLATHGYLNSNAYYSFLAFGSEKTDSLQDNAFHAYELLGMDLRAELVVLSACETGRGAFQRGEGVLSLARSFMHAGSGCVVMSLWRVSDQSTAALMERFYEGLGEGLSKDDALRRAKLHWLQQANALQGHPFFWAAFVAVGNTAPLLDPWATWRLGAWVLGGLGALVLAVRWFQKNRA
jgi:CHAT domain-containing protein